MRYRNQEKDDEIVQYITEHYMEYNYSPTIREIAQAVGLSATSVQQRVNKLREQNRLSKNAKNRGYSTKETTQQKLSIPLAGVVACGQPLFAEENIEEYLNVSKSLLGGPGEYFALRCSGDSMINVGINSGDIVFVKKQDTADEGQIVVALCDDDSATLKTFYTDYENEQYILRPETDTMEDIIVKECRIQGVAVKVLKDLNS